MVALKNVFRKRSKFFSGNNFGTLEKGIHGPECFKINMNFPLQQVHMFPGMQLKLGF
jgi:hypothetical protein